MEGEKMQYISVLRVCSMMLIVLYHSLCFYIGVWWYLNKIEVPIWRIMAFPVVKIGLTTFVFISGFLYGYMYLERGKYRMVRSFIINKSKRLLIPYFFWGIIMILMIPALHIPWINLFTGIAHLWFLLMLIEILPAFLVAFYCAKYRWGDVSFSAMIILKRNSFPFCQSELYNNLDKNSMGIYIFNQIVVFVLLLIPDINMFLSHHSFVGVFLIFIVSFIIPWLLSNLLNMRKYTSFLLG